MSSIRLANPTEINLVKMEIEALIGIESFDKIFSANEQFLIYRDKKIQFIVVAAQLADFLFKSLSYIEPFLYSVGTCLALFNRLEGPCKITLEGLHLIAPYSHKKIVLDPEATLKFLYGQNIRLSKTSSILNANKEEKVLVFDQSNRVLGIGALQENMQLVPVIDLGFYLRKKLK